MAKEQRSLQDLIRARQRSGFVGRHKQVIQYRENLSLPVDDDRRLYIFNIHGDAGVGKTYLTKHLQQIASGNGALVAYVDESVDDVISVMVKIANDLKLGGVRLTEFDKRVTAYKQRRHELESDPQAPDSVAAFLTRTAVTIGLHAARDVPVAGSLLAPIDVPTTAEQINRARVYLIRKFNDQSDVRLLLSPSDELTPVFVAELKRMTAGRSVALFLDTYERTSGFLDGWLRNLYAGKYGDLPADIITTIAGQYPLNVNLWSEYLSVIADVPLAPFSQTEAREFLAVKNISDEPLIKAILSLSGCLPMWLATLAEAHPNSPSEVGDPAEEAVERFLKWEKNTAHRAIAILAALPRSLNQDILSIVAPPDQAQQLFGWLCGLPFVSRKSGSWRYHEVVRASMLRLQRTQAPSGWRSSHILLAKAHAQWASDMASENWEDEDWVSHKREEMYHQLCADPAKCLPQALVGAVKAAEHSAIRARQWAVCIADAGRDADNVELHQWGSRLRNGIHDGDFSEYLTYLIEDARLDGQCLKVGLELRGARHQIAGRYEDAVADFTCAIELDRNDVWLIRRRGSAYMSLGRFEDALADFDKIIEENPDDGPTLTIRGAVYMVMRRFHDAIDDLDRALEFDSNEPMIMGSRGLLYLSLQRYDDALADFDRAIELDPTYALAFGGRGRTYHELKRHDDALADFDRAIELDPAHAPAFSGRGRTYQELKRHDDALADYNQAIKLNPNETWAIGNRASNNVAMKRYGDAVADFTRHIELDPSDAWAICKRGQTYLEMESYGDAVDDFSRTIELDPNDVVPFMGRASAYTKLERYDDALTDLNHVIQINPDSAGTLGLRAAIYMMKGKHGDALADYTRAMDINPILNRLITSRGYTFRALKRYEDALSDFTRAIEMDPSDAWAMSGRGQAYLELKFYDDALKDFTRTVELHPNDASGFSLRATAYIELERYDDALADFSRAIELDPNNAQAISGRAEVRRLLERYDDALADFSRAIELDPNHAWAIGSRGQTYQALGRYEESLADYSRAITIDPEMEWVIEARSKVNQEMHLRD